MLDPAFIPGTGTPEPGGMTAVDLLLAVRTVAAELDLVGADVVEVIPTCVGTDDYSALVADRVIREALTASRCAGGSSISRERSPLVAAGSTHVARPSGAQRQRDRRLHLLRRGVDAVGRRSPSPRPPPDLG